MIQLPNQAALFQDLESRYRTMTQAEFYDAFMSLIDSDLVSTRVNDLKSIYTDETPEAKAKRSKRYQQSFSAYDEIVTAFFAQIHGETREATKAKRAMDEARDRAAEEALGEEILTQLAHE